MKKLCLVVGALATLFLATPASGAVTQSNVTSPLNLTFLDPDTDAPSVDLTVSGTATAGGGDLADIVCVDKVGANLDTIEQDVPINAGTFSATVDQNDFVYYICEVIAVPANAAGPYNMTNFNGPVISNSGFERFFVSGGPNDGALSDYGQNSSGLEGYWSATSAGSCYVQDGYALEPTSLQYAGTGLWACSTIPQSDVPTPDGLKVGGAPALLPGEQDDALVGFRGIADFTHSVAPGVGTMRVSDTEKPVVCVDVGCSAYADSGLTLFQKQTGGTRGHTLAIDHRWVNETASPKQLDITYRVGTDDDVPGWRLPGETTYSSHAAGDPAVLPGVGPASAFVTRTPAAGCPNFVDPCGSVTWSRAPSSAAFFDNDKLDLTYSISVPANGEKTLGFTYSVGFPQSAVDGFAATAEDAYTPESAFLIGKLKRNKKKGTATLAVDVPGPGTLLASGKKIKPSELIADAAGTLTVPVAAKGKVPKKKLKKKGKLKVAVGLTFTAADSAESSTQTKNVTLKKKRKKKGGGKR